MEVCPSENVTMSARQSLGGNKERTELGFGVAFVKQVCLILRIVFPAWRSRSVVLLICLLLMLSLAEVLAYNVGLISSWYYKALPRRDYGLFVEATVYATLFVVSMAVVNALCSFIQSVCYLQIRATVTARLHRLYFPRDNFYRVCAFTSIDNPDQRITQDVERLSSAVLQILNLVLNPFTIAFYTYLVFKRAGGLAVLFFYIFFLVFSIGNKLLVNSFAKFFFDQERCEGDFRFKHVQLRSQAEAVAFSRAGPLEQRKAEEKFENLLAAQQRLIVRQALTKLWTGLGDYLGSIVSYLTVSVAIFGGSMKDEPSSALPSQIAQFTFFNLYLVNKFTTLIDASEKAIDIAGTAHRIVTLIKRLQDVDLLQQRTAQLPSSVDVDSPLTVHRPGDELLEIKGLTFGVPGHADGEFLVRDMSLVIYNGRHVLISGRSGIGKSSLLRVLAGLWPPHTHQDSCLLWRVGRRELSDPSTVMFLPQRSYLTGGTLLELIFYPRPLPTQRELMPGEVAAVDQLCTDFGLEAVVRRVGGLQGVSAEDWSEVLSPGEQQRLALVRLCYHCPLLAFLDEATCHVDAEFEEWTYRRIHSLGITTVSVGHRPSMRALHHINLQIEGEGSWRVESLSRSPGNDEQL